MLISKNYPQPNISMFTELYCEILSVNHELIKCQPSKCVFSAEVTRLEMCASVQVVWPCHRHHQGTALVVGQSLILDVDIVDEESLYGHTELHHTL